ncbi:efflux RND transporter periplasmic adaptor subunit [Paraliomyxa miuraensis]|uniref:efflux RND transporter periplasmic adaptor subunit n=1 Tax=Paraliomyxa miuraensis TaxID=376150 RepID=UPI00224D31AB|nr:efflux RND transporter periplasmic adaptor subunit [Paraliomyxa miuraensis]MCX4246913.1 efflux RND transporter periplasmic adaptor subunit [Paraliomyxa miuraensis]
MSRTRTLIIVVTVLGSLGGLGVLFSERVDAALQAREQAAKPVELEPPRVRTEPLERHRLEAKVSFTGTLRAVRRVEVIPEIPGRIEDVMVNVGDHVEPGQLLAIIEHRSLKLAQNQAKANRSAAAASLDRARLEVETAERELERVRSLANRGAASQAELDRSQSAVDTARAMLRSAQSQHLGAKAAAGLSSDSLDDSRILSPLAGTVTRRDIDMGTRVTPGVSAFEIQDIDELELVGAVTAKDFARLAIGQTVEITVDARPGETFEGTVKTMSPSLDPVTRRATIEITVNNQAHHLLPNQFADATVVVEQREGVLAVHRDALAVTPEGSDVFTVREGFAARAHAKLGPPEGEWVPVLEGLAEGDPVVVAGHAELRDGLAVVVTDGGQAP